MCRYVKLTDWQSHKSALAEAIEVSNEAHREVLGHLPTGAPVAATGTRAVPAARTDRAPLRVVSLGSDSYRSVGTVERNQKRAAYRAKQRAKRKAQKTGVQDSL